MDTVKEQSTNVKRKHILRQAIQTCFADQTLDNLNNLAETRTVFEFDPAALSFSMIPATMDSIDPPLVYYRNTEEQEGNTNNRGFLIELKKLQAILRSSIVDASAFDLDSLLTDVSQWSEASSLVFALCNEEILGFYALQRWIEISNDNFPCDYLESWCSMATFEKVAKAIRENQLASELVNEISRVFFLCYPLNQQEIDYPRVAKELDNLLNRPELLALKCGEDAEDSEEADELAEITPAHAIGFRPADERAFAGQRSPINLAANPTFTRMWGDRTLTVVQQAAHAAEQVAQAADILNQHPNIVNVGGDGQCGLYALAVGLVTYLLEFPNRLADVLFRIKIRILQNCDTEQLWQDTLRIWHTSTTKLDLIKSIEETWQIVLATIAVSNNIDPADDYSIDDLSRLANLLGFSLHVAEVDLEYNTLPTPIPVSSLSSSDSVSAQLPALCIAHNGHLAGQHWYAYCNKALLESNLQDHDSKASEDRTKKPKVS